MTGTSKLFQTLSAGQNSALTQLYIGQIYNQELSFLKGSGTSAIDSREQNFSQDR